MHICLHRFASVAALRGATASVLPPLTRPAGHMASPIINYLNHVGDFFASQKKLLPRAMLGDSITAMQANVQKQIHSMKSIDPAEATVLNTAIHKSAFPQAIKEELALAVMKQLSGSVDEDDVGKGQNPLCPYNYCTQSDISYFEDLMKTQQQVAPRCANASTGSIAPGHQKRHLQQWLRCWLACEIPP